MGGKTTVDVIVNGRVVKALLDTGATVSVISRATVDKLGLPIRPVRDFIHVECANGQALPYLGYVTMSINLLHNPPSTCLALVVPDHDGPGAAPLLLGTNILPSLLKASGSLPESLQLVANCLKARDSQLTATGGSLAFIRIVGQEKLCLEANKTIVTPVQLDRAMSYHKTHALIEPCLHSVLPEGVDVSPSLCVYNNGDIDIHEIVLSNCSTNTVQIKNGAVVAQLTPVVVTDSICQMENMNDSVPSLDLSSTAFSSHDQEQLNNLVKEYADIMARSELDLGHYNGVEHTIELEDPKPFKQRHRRIPPHMFEEVRDHLRQLEACGVIRPSKSQYSSPVVCCRRKDGKLRLCVDYRLLNSRTRKDNYCLPRVDEILDSLRGAKYFSRLDLKSGYHQISIREDHKPYTAFTVGPLGFWEHNRLTFGLCNIPGFAGYYRKFVEKYSEIARPLNSLLPPTRTEIDKGSSKVTKWEWEDKHEHSFQCLKNLLCAAPLLAYADFTKPFELHIDASTVGLGAVLYQVIDGAKKVIAYASRSLSKSEERYPAHKLEFLCLKWSVCEKFNDYLWGAPKFLVRTDNNPLTYVLTTAKLDATGHRWLAALAAFDFEIEYTPGVSNQDADALSRLPSGRIDIASVQAMCSVDFAPFAATMAVFAEKTEEETSPFPHISLTELRQAQNVNEILGVWMTAMRKRECPILKRTPNPARHGIMKKNWQKFCFYRGLLHRKVEGEKPQLVLLPNISLQYVRHFTMIWVIKDTRRPWVL
ncbi:hypothetical protein RRG08_018517 [Elysia crispata]|uniref:Peptidase A2 domain-containing protein n=1 Tax=Elysia crispata TaxID=231223 RepID=A0AAE0YDH0_9GAST|nr:hypothetical protein RRG08_018517 [Elysia crispata]